jgi:hypothetical protein
MEHSRSGIGSHHRGDRHRGSHERVAGQARQAAAQEDVLPALLVEVRGLRAAMEQMASAGPRVQLALGRVQLQEQRVNTLVRRIDDGKAHLADTQREYEAAQQQLRGIEAGLREPAKPEGPPLAELQNMQREIERELARRASEVQRITADITIMETIWRPNRGDDRPISAEALEQSLIRRGVQAVMPSSSATPRLGKTTIARELAQATGAGGADSIEQALRRGHEVEAEGYRVAMPGTTATDRRHRRLRPPVAVDEV